ncbi:MAG: hypothetical protein R3C10_10025 [Pirellulales bacterium]
MSETKRLCERLASQFRGVGALLEEHLADNRELLPHVFFGDVTRYVLAGGDDKSAVVQCLEDAMHSGVPAVDELIAVSFVENIETQDELARVLVGVNGNKIRGEWNQQHTNS